MFLVPHLNNILQKDTNVAIIASKLRYWTLTWRKILKTINYRGCLMQWREQLRIKRWNICYYKIQVEHCCVAILLQYKYTVWSMKRKAENIESIFISLNLKIVVIGHKCHVKCETLSILKNQMERVSFLSSVLLSLSWYWYCCCCCFISVFILVVFLIQNHHQNYPITRFIIILFYIATSPSYIVNACAY